MSKTHSIKDTGTTDGRERHYRITSGSVVVAEDCPYTSVRSACERAEREGRFADVTDTEGDKYAVGHARFTATPTNCDEQPTIILL